VSLAAIPALRTLRDDTLVVARSLSESEWALPSDCAGWSVRDVYAHMAASLHGIVDPAFMRTGDDPDDMEAGMEVGVAERRDAPIADVVAEYEQYSAQAIDALATMQEGEMANAQIPMGNLGTHPLHILANAFVFDAYCHLRNDLITPYGPLLREPPEASAAVLGPIMEWMIAGLPQMCADALRYMDRPIVLQLDGPGGGAYPIGPEGDSAATIITTTDAFVRWGTRRRSWRSEGVSVIGDEAYGILFCDACNVI
jgi:uncharacterized protein (TIGR03083 family)